ncbi:MAG: adenylate/guanylate cyclase domain-containing protein [Acidimicrobiia bacterium]
MTEIALESGTCVGAVLFTDLVGFTEYNDAVGDPGAVRVLEDQTRMAESATETRPGARIVKELGDGLMIWFSSAIDGLEGAIALLMSVGDARSAGEFPLAMRMGLHHGGATARGRDFVGQTVNIAARVSALAGPGELLISDDVVAACAGSFDRAVTPVGAVQVKGVQRPIWLHRYASSA